MKEILGAGNVAKPAAIVQKLHQNEQADWVSAITEIHRLNELEGETALDMGDRFAEIASRWGDKHVRLAADQANVPIELARQRHYVAVRVPKTSPIRKLNLTYSHIRALAFTEDPEKWAEETEKNGWTVRELVDQIHNAKGEKIAASGQPCIQCEKSLPNDPQSIISFRIGKSKPAWCCGPHCAIAYFEELNENVQNA